MLDLENLPPSLRRRDAAEYLFRRHGIKLAPATFAWLATRGGGPRFQKDGAWPIYPIKELDAWAAKRLSPLVASTSELKAVNA
jgi:hypothetical protein